MKQMSQLRDRGDQEGRVSGDHLLRSSARTRDPPPGDEDGVSVVGQNLDVCGKGRSGSGTGPGAVEQSTQKDTEPSRQSPKSLHSLPRPVLDMQQTPLDLDAEAEAALACSSRSKPFQSLASDFAISPPRGKRRKLSQDPSNLSGQPLLQWLLKRHVERGGSPTNARKAMAGPCGDSGAEVPEASTPVRAFAKAGCNAKKLLQEQLQNFKGLLDANESINLENEFGLVPPPAKSVTSKASRRNQKSGPAHSVAEGALLVLPAVCLQTNATLAAEASDAWDRVRKKALLEAGRAHRRALKADTSKLPWQLPWRTWELSEDLRSFDQALHQLQRRSELEPGRRVLMRQLGAQPKAGLFEDPPQGSPMASAALNAVLTGSLPAASTGTVPAADPACCYAKVALANTKHFAEFFFCLAPVDAGNELEAATLLPSRGRGSIASMISSVQPDLLDKWHSLPISQDAASSKDALLCLRLFREASVGKMSSFAGRLAREGLTKDQPLAPSGGQEHCFCGSCSEWLLRNNSKTHQCRVGKPHASAAASLKLFHQAWDGLELRLSFQHRNGQVEISCDAALDNGLRRLMWSQIWEPTQVSSRWRLTAEGSQSKDTSQTIQGPVNLALTISKNLPNQPKRFLLSSAQLTLLGWMRQQEQATVFTSLQTVRQALCEVGSSSGAGLWVGLGLFGNRSA